MQDIYLVNKNIQRIIREKGLASNKVARAAGISEAVLSNIVRCKRKVYADEVADLAAALRTSVAELFRVPERKRECRTCQRWAQFYMQTHGGPFMKADYGLCMKPGHWGVHEPKESCEEHKYRREEDHNAEN